jgi:hypothetical protein
MSVADDLERLDAERATPPAVLYKYVIPDRIDVLQNASIRFTPPINTNDIFEVRQTFDLVAGPKFQAFLKEVAPDVDFEEPLRNALDEMHLGSVSNEHAKALVAVLGGGDLEANTRRLLDRVLDVVPELMNQPTNVDRLLDKFSSNQLLLSLTERPDSSPMWAHYAANSSGFVIGFDTSSDFFRRGDSKERQGLHKVKYFDGRVREIADDPYAALVSKQADWAYEREWRLYLKAQEVANVISANGDEIHLVSFPRQAVQRVILGTRAPGALEDRLRTLLAASYPGVPLMRVKANRVTATLIEEPA